MVSSSGVTNTNIMNRVNGLIEYIPEDRTNITENITNTYTNPSTQTPALLSIHRIFNIGGTFQVQSTSGYMSITPSTLPYIVINTTPDIILTQSANNTITSTIQSTRTMKVNVSAYFSVYSSGSAYNSQYSFYNITDSFSEIWSAQTCNVGQNYDSSLHGVVTLDPTKTYTLDLGASTTFANQQV